MPRPGMMCFVGADAARKWQEIEAAQSAARLSADEMARLLGFTSGGAYRGWKAKNPPKIPVEAWARFEAVRGTIKDQEDQIDEQFVVSELLKNPIRLGSGNLRAIAFIYDDFHGFLSVNGDVDEVEYRGEYRACEWEGCDKKFIPRSWNHKVCNRAWHIEQEKALSSNEASAD